MDVLGILQSSYANGVTAPSRGQYVNVDRASYEGTWTGRYSNGKAFSISISDVSGFRAKVKYQSSGTTSFQQVLIKDSSFRVGDSKFTLTGAGKAQVKTVVTSPVDGSTVLNTAVATKET